MTGPTFAFTSIVLAAIVLYLVAMRATVRPFTITLVWMLPATLGLALGFSETTLQVRTVLTYMLCFLALVLGYVIADRSRLSRSLGARVAGPDVALFPTAVLIVFSMLTAYHFARAGFSVFSDDVALERWDFQRSGLFGLPARAFQIGLPIAIIMGFRSSWSDTSRKRRLLYTLLGLWSLGFLLSGFKSGLLRGLVVGYAAIWTPMLEARARDRSRVVFRFAVGGIIAMIAASLLLMIPSLARSTNLLDRVTETPGRAAATALEQIEDGVYLGARPTYLTEMEILARRSIPFLSDDGRLVFNELSSGNASGRLGGNQFRTPVTPSGPATAIYNFGVFAPLWTLGIGAAFRFLEALAGNAYGRPFSRVLATVGIIGLHDHLTKGGFAFFLFNWSAMLTLAWIIGRVLPLGPRATSITSPEVPSGRRQESAS